jgi:hypothetical protein
VAALVGLAVLVAAAGALAFNVSPPTVSVQAGNQATVMLSALPVASDGGATCLEATGTSAYLTVIFSPTCGSSSGWSSTATIRTIPATAAGTYQIGLDLCGTPGCQNIGSYVRPSPPIQAQTLTVVVTGAPVPVETVTIAPQLSPSTAAPSTPPPVTRTSPSPSAAQRSPATRSPSASASPSAAAPPSPSPTLALGVPPSLTLDRSSVAPGGSIHVSGTGCSNGAPVVLTVAGATAGSLTAQANGSFETDVRLPSSMKPGRYQIVAQCGPTFQTFVDIMRPAASHRTPILVGLGVLIVALAVVVGLSARRIAARRGPAG